MDFGARSSGTSLDLQGLIFRFYDHWLKGEENGVVDEKPVRIYVMGENAWRMEDEWPLSRATEVKYYLHSAGRASTLNGDGVLGIEPPGVEPIDDYVYNPIDPVPTRGGPLCFNIGAIRGGACSTSGPWRPGRTCWSTPHRRWTISWRSRGR